MYVQKSHIQYYINVASRAAIIIEKVKGKVHPCTGTEGKVKCTLVQALRLCTGCTAHRGSSGIAPLYRH